MTHSSRKLQNVVSIHKYWNYFFLEKERKYCAAVSVHCPLRRCVLFSLYRFPLQSNATQTEQPSNLIICPMLHVKKKMLTVWMKLHNPFCVLVLGVTHASMASAKLYVAGGGGKRGKEIIENLRLLLFSWCNEDVDDSIYSHIYSRVLYTGLRARSPPTRKQNPHFLPTSLSKSRGDKQSHALLPKTKSKKKNPKQQVHTRWPLPQPSMSR